MSTHIGHNLFTKGMSTMGKKSRSHTKLKGGKTTTLTLIKGYSYLRRCLIYSESKGSKAYTDPDNWRLPYITINYNIRTENIYEGRSVLRFGAAASEEYELYNPETQKILKPITSLGEATFKVIKDGSDDIKVINNKPLNGDDLEPVTFDVLEYRLRMCDVFDMLGKIKPSLVWKNKSSGEQIPIWDRVLPYGDIRDEKNNVLMRVVFDE